MGTTTDLILDLSANPVGVLPSDGSGGAGRWSAKKGNSETRELHFQADGALTNVPAGVTSMVLEVRARGDYDGGDPLVRVVDFATVDPGGGGATYLTCDLVWDGVDLRAALDDGAEGYQTVALMAELMWETASGVRSSLEWEVVLWNDLVKDLEAATAPLPPVPTMEDWLAGYAIRYHPAITGLTGGAATDLDSLATEDMAADTVVGISVPAELLPSGSITFGVSLYRLVADTSAESAPEYVRPDDYAAGTNEKMWVLMQARLRGLEVTGTLSAGGNVDMPGLPVADPVEAGRLWNDAGTLKVSAG